MQVEQVFQHFVAMAFKDVTQSQIEAVATKRAGTH